MTDSINHGDKLRDTVREAYSAIARTGTSCCCGTSCGGATDSGDLALSIGYGADDLGSIPDGANLGLSCGNPTAIASLRPGETVVDLGCGAGFDVFIAARVVGPGGRVIGVDMTADMLSKARRNARAFEEMTGFDNVEFRLGEIEHLPVADSSVDVVISNCVINLSSDKSQVWREIARVLKPGGRLSISDMALLKPLPEVVVKSVEALVGCIAGAVLVEETEGMIRDAGLERAVLEPKSGYVESMTDFNDPLYKQIMSALPEGIRVGDYVTSLTVTAYKPA